MSRNIQHYFISPTYDVSESAKKDVKNPMGRFVFEQKGTKEIVPIALAEESADKLEHEPGSVEHLFQDELKEEIGESK